MSMLRTVHMRHRQGRVDFDVRNDVSSCVRELQDHGWILIKGGVKGNTGESGELIGAENKYLTKILEVASQGLGWAMTKPITVAIRPETRIFRVTKDAPNEAPVLSYSCYHLGRDKTASLPTEWMIEIMYDSGGSMSNNTNVVPAIVDDLFICNSRLTRSHPQLRNPAEGTPDIALVHVEYIMNVMDTKAAIARPGDAFDAL